MSIAKFLANIIKFFHAIVIGALWFSPLYVLNPYILIGAIVFQTIILLQFRYTNDRCILTMLEYYLSGQKVDFKQSNPSSEFNKAIALLIGKNNMTHLNMYIPYFVILGICLKLAFVV